MKKKMIIILCILAFSLTIVALLTRNLKMENKKDKTNKIAGTVMNYDAKSVTIEDENNDVYTLAVNDVNFDIGDYLTIKYTGILDVNKKLQSCKVIGYTVEEEKDEDGIPVSWLDDGIFSPYYKAAMDKLNTLSLDEKIGQVLLVRYPDQNQVDILKKYNLGGFVFFEKDFKDKTLESAKEMISNLQDNSKIPLLTAVDEEGGTVVRVSSNSKIVKEKFKSPSELYNNGGFDEIRKDTIEKSKVLYNLGLNLNLAPVVDVSTDPKDYMYERTLKQNVDLTSTFAKTVISASKGTGVSYTLKHFPGYGNNLDTHKDSATDNRSYEEIKNNNLPPFEAGIKEGAEAVLISHNIVNSIDGDNPASLSKKVHELLRNDLSFSGVIITDDIEMGALSSLSNVLEKAILAGNDLIITSDVDKSFADIKEAIDNGTISKKTLEKKVFKILAWKYYKGLIPINQK